jgi:hypothetical protein
VRVSRAGDLYNHAEVPEIAFSKTEFQVLRHQFSMKLVLKDSYSTECAAESRLNSCPCGEVVAQGYRL